MKYILCFSFLLSVFIFSCSKDKAELVKAPEPVPLAYCDSMKSAGKVSFKCVVDSIIRTNCATNSNCHGTGSPGQSWQPTFLSHTTDSTYAARIKDRAVVQKTMPPGGPLPDSLLQKLASWIDDGAKNN